MTAAATLSATSRKVRIMDRLSRLFVRTLRDDPVEAETPSHRRLLRGGYVLRVASGVYTYLPLGLRVLRNVERIVREEMVAAGAQELLMPALQPRDLWEATGRWSAYGEAMFRLADRKGAGFCLGPTHEELVASVIAGGIRGYRELPVCVFQIQTKYRDEQRPRAGLIRAREFVMKDGYSFHPDRESLRATYETMRRAYENVFARCGARFRAVQAQAGEIGGDVNHEFMAPTEIGEDLVVHSPGGSYAANLQVAAGRPPTPARPGTAPLTRLRTPGVTTVADVSAHLGVPAAAILKTMLYAAPRRGGGGEEVVAVVVPGDREVNEHKLAALLGATPTPLDGAGFATRPRLARGYVGPAGLAGHVDRLIADRHVAAGRDWVAGANEPDHHVTGCNLGRDFTPDELADVTNARAGDEAPDGSGPLALERAVEIGHIFQLGTRYTEPLGGRYLDAAGVARPLVMGCYGIGVSRLVSVVAEQHHDEAGIRWPAAIAPYDVEVVPLGATTDAAAAIGAETAATGLDVLLDDRPVSAGVKFADADLIGCPARVVVGRRLAAGIVEVSARDRSVTLEVSPAEVPTALRRLAARA
jgi:prolyl-tRNA synthetase